MRNTRIFLIGPMGAGKTTVGKRLAQVLGLPFYDSDRIIEERTGAAIPLIFDVEGEAGFRRREAAVIDELTQLDKVVLATGGGAVLLPENRAHLRERGTVVYLEASVDKQFERTRKDRNRPLLQTDDPRARLLALFEQRQPLYRDTAHIVMSTERGNARTILSEIVRQLEALGDAET
ncbi:MAG TPA: shikimate kinase AroK [Gammaproteobacteria bacterium]|jgi:shikimate kinase|nr:shikimate kinase AroK [Gammaproteobacteria bacterium]